MTAGNGAIDLLEGTLTLNAVGSTARVVTMSADTNLNLTGSALSGGVRTQDLTIRGNGNYSTGVAATTNVTITGNSTAFTWGNRANMAAYEINSNSEETAYNLNMGLVNDFGAINIGGKTLYLTSLEGAGTIFIEANGAGVIYLNQAADTIYSGNLGSGNTSTDRRLDLNKSGVGTLTVTGQVFSQNVNGGVNGYITGGTLKLTADNTLAMSGATAAGTATWTVSDDATLEANVKSLGRVASNALVNLNGGTLKLLSESDAYYADQGSTIVGTITLGEGDNQTNTIDLNGRDVSLDTVLSGGNADSGQLVITGNGKLTLNGANTYTSKTTIASGTVAAGNASAFGVGEVTIGSNATLNTGSVAISNDLKLADGTATAVGGNALTVNAISNLGASISGETSSFGNNKIENAVVSNAAIAAGAAEVKDSSFINGSYIYNTGDTTTLNNVTFNNGTGIDDGTFMVDALTATGTFTASTVDFTTLSFDIDGLTDIGTKTIFTTTDVLTIGALEGLGTGILNGAAGYNYTWNVIGDNTLVITVSQVPTELTVTGVSYEALEKAWTFTMTTDAYTAFTTGLDAFTGDLLFDDAAMELFMSIKGGNEGLVWLENLTITNGTDELNITDKFGDFTINGADYIAGKGYMVAEIPEPTTVTLSLLALAGLAARRRRKA